MNLDLWQIGLVAVSAAVGGWAQIKLKSTFSKYAKVPCSNGMTGLKAAAQLLKINNITDVRIGPIAGSLTDHYSHTAEAKQIALSEPVYNVSSIAAVGVAAHEAGHAVQYATKYKGLSIRAPLRRFSGISSKFGPYIIMAGLFIPDYPIVMDIGIVLFSLAVLCSILTLPVEFNASSRALAALKANNMLATPEELKGAKKVLSAAAMTYVAAALTNCVTLLGFILKRKRATQRKKRR
jgi:Zn-dependent membrane protease YugP